MNTLLFEQHQYIHNTFLTLAQHLQLICMKALLFTVFAITCLQVHSQEQSSDTAHVLSEVVVSARRLDRFSAGLQVKSLDKISFEEYPSILLSEFLATQSPYFIKTYGAGGLATISMRGTASQHTAIYWNGFNINPPNIDMADLSMLPLFLFNRIDLVSGGGSTLFGNGSIGGSIHLNSQNGYKENKLRIASSLGQYNDRLLALTSDYRISNLHLSTSAWYNAAENDFIFVNTAKANNPKERLSNADVMQLGFMQEAHLPLSAGHHLKAGFWYQEREAGIPPAMTMLRSHARQHDRMIRGYAQWNLEKGNLGYSLKSGYNSDYLHYTDTLIGLDSEIRVGSWLSEAEFNINISQRTQLTSGVNFELHNAKVDAYTGQVNPGQFSLFVLATHAFPELKWVLTAGARKEFHSDFESIPPALSLGWRGRLIEQLSGRFNLSANYRTPTLNDRYWNPGGNPGLLAETSLNAEAGLDLEVENEKLGAVFSATVYNNRISNWITWLPTEFNYWSPENISAVMTYGLESRINASYAAGKFTHRIEIAYANTKSLYGAKSFRDISYHPQLIYTPVHTASLSYSASLGRWSIQYFHKLTGPRFTDRANTNQLPAFHTADISLSRKVTISKSRFIVNASVKNLTNHAYQVIQYRPMPGRTFNISLIFDQFFQKQSTTKTKKQ
jgi:iron complex outermembrane receptor protein